MFVCNTGVELIIMLLAGYAMSAETAIVDDGGCVFRCGGKIVHSKKNSRYSVAAVALLFMQDEDKPHGSAYLSLKFILSLLIFSLIFCAYELVCVIYSFMWHCTQVCRL